jgi:prepilin-type N-terminal cleavage/methylation domain-containing protein
MRAGQSSAFTLIEMLTVVAVIAVLLAMLMPSLSASRDATRQAVCASNQHQLAQTAASYGSSNRLNLPPVNNVVSNSLTTMHWARWFYEASKTYWNMGYFWQGNFIKTGRSFFCPANTTTEISYERYTDANGVFFQSYQPGPTASNGVRLSYYFNPVTKGDANRTRKFSRMGTADPHAILVVDTLESASFLAHTRGPTWNLARFDGSVHSVTSARVLSLLSSANVAHSDPAGYVVLDEVLKLLAR